MKRNSDIIKKGFDRAPHRSLLRATGIIQDESDGINRLLP